LEEGGPGDSCTGIADPSSLVGLRAGKELPALLNDGIRAGGLNTRDVGWNNELVERCEKQKHPWRQI